MFTFPSKTAKYGHNRMSTENFREFKSGKQTHHFLPTLSWTLYYLIMVEDIFTNNSKFSIENHFTACERGIIFLVVIIIMIFIPPPSLSQFQFLH